MITLRKITRIIAGAALLALLTQQMWKVFSISSRPTDDKIVLRLTHTQLETGLREAIDALARAYEARHPGVRIEQNPVPERAYDAYIRTQLTGGSPPDLIGVRPVFTDELCARYLLPLSSAVALPNPYNDGTSLAGVPWRSTFIENLTTFPAYRREMQETYGIPFSALTVRLYVNARLWQKLLGDTPYPRTLSEFLSASERIAAAENGRYLPVAASRYNGPILVGSLYASATNRAALRIDRDGLLRVDARRRALAYLQNGDGFDEQEFATALQEVRSVSRYFQPAFMQLERQDAMFAFLQERAVMIASGLWDSGGLTQQATFPIAVTALPMSASPYSLGTISETGGGLATAFAIARDSPHAEVALDFLRFAASREGNALFTRISGWLPAVDGVEPREDVAAFTPVRTGYPEDLDLDWMKTGPSTHRLHKINAHLLFSPSGSIDAYRAAMQASLPESLRDDLARHQRDQHANAARLDLSIATRALTQSDPEDPRLAALLETQLMAELLAERIQIETSLLPLTP